MWRDILDWLDCATVPVWAVLLAFVAATVWAFVTRKKKP